MVRIQVSLTETCFLSQSLYSYILAASFASLFGKCNENGEKRRLLPSSDEGSVTRLAKFSQTVYSYYAMLLELSLSF